MIFILADAAVQLCRSLLVCIFKSVLTIISVFLFWSDVHLMLTVISQPVMPDQMMSTEMYRRFWTQVNFEKRIFFLMDPQQFSVLTTAQLLELLTAIIGILQRRLGLSRESVTVVRSQDPSLFPAPVPFSEYSVHCNAWSLHCTPRRSDIP